MRNLKNINEEMVWQELNELLKQVKMKCPCEDCQAEVVTKVLNELKPHYVASLKDEVLLRSYNGISQLKVDIFALLNSAIKQVEEKPPH